MSLNEASLSILRAVFAMATLTLIMSAWMSVKRISAMKQFGIALQDAAHAADLKAKLPSTVTRVADNYNHLFEAPTVFYAVAIALAVARIVDPVTLFCAWAFVAARILHSIVQATFNRVSVRATLYTLSWLALATMIIRGTAQLWNCF